MEKISVIGLGYIGLPTAAVFAKAGYNVLGVDINSTVVDSIIKGQAHIEEPGLSELVAQVISSGHLRASTELEPADVFIIAVPTPIYPDQTANLEYVIHAAKSILPFIQENNLVIVESTIPPRTINDIVAPIFTADGWDVEKNLYIAHCPERVLPGRILIELKENTRIVGGLTPKAAKKASDIYRKIVTGQVLETKAVTAEMSKLMENTYRDVNIALSNELSKICSKLEVDTLEVIRLANHHPRVNLHQPGPGVGGHCLAVDPYFVIEKAPEESIIISNSRKINNSMPEFVVDHLKRVVEENSKIAVFGLTYKGNIDDVRESPAIEIVYKLGEIGFITSVYDPHVKPEQVSFPLSSFEEAIDKASCIIVLSDHNEFKTLDEDKIKMNMTKPIVFDTKNCVNIQDKSIQYFNYSNLYELNNLKTVLYV